MTAITTRKTPARKEFSAFKKAIRAQTKEAISKEGGAREMLVRSGILSSSGQLTKHYKNLES